MGLNSLKRGDAAAAACATLTPMAAATSPMAVVAMRQELVQRRIEQADGHRAARHDLEQLDEVLALRGQELGERRAACPPVSSARIISRIGTMRLSSKNICSVRQSPMPSAPKASDWRASAGVSALARTFMRRKLSAHPSGVEVLREISARASATRPLMIWPVEPSMVTTSPLCSSRCRRLAASRARDRSDDG